MSWKLQRAALAACVLLLGVSSALAGRFDTAPDPGLYVHTKAVKHAPSAPGCSGPQVIIGGATICGFASQRPGTGINVYEGIDYATAQRWQYSTLSTPVSGNAIQPGNICPQEGSDPTWPPMAENCLNLNIWTPNGTAAGSLPVMVFIHGGAFVSGHGSSPLFDGSALAQRGLVVVTLNYRLGALGFLVSNHKGIVAPGNMGLFDQQNALKWVQTYIANFGGNANRVTIFGESAGAMSVGLHLFVMPNSHALFNAAMMESNPMGNVYNTSAQFEPTGNKFLYDLCTKHGPGVCDENWFETVSFQTILLEQKKFEPALNSGLSSRGILWAPVIDNSGVLAQPFDGYATWHSAKLTPKPFVFGANTGEGVLFAATTVGGNSASPSKAIYEDGLNYEFGSSSASTIMAASPRYNISTGKYCYLPKYRHDPPSVFCYYSPWGQSLANVLTDYSFATGSVVAAMAANDPGAHTFAYFFARRPIFDMYPLYVDKGACWPVTQNVCHGNELPYVFNTLGLLAPNVSAADQALADRMTADWSAFALNPTSPGLDWTPFTGTLTPTATKFDSGTALPGQPFFPSSNEAFWKTRYQ
jgi:carboxylesterase type B